MKARPRYFDFSRGLTTTRYGRSGRADDFQTFQDVEIDRGGASARKGMVRVGRITNSNTICDFDGTNDSVNLVSASPLTGCALTQWTLEVLFQTDSTASDRYILGKAAAGSVGVTIKHTTTPAVVVVIEDSAAATTTLTFSSITAGTLCALAVVRDGANLTAWLNGSTTTGTMSATNALAAGVHAFGKNNGANWFDGRIDRATFWNTARTNRKGLYGRLLNPRNPHVLFDYVFEQDSAGDVLDRSKYGLHAQTSGTPSFAGASLANNPAPVQALAMNVRRSGARELVAVSYGRIHTATVQG